MLGLAVARYVLALEPLASAPPETVVAALAPTVRRYLTGPWAPRPRRLTPAGEVGARRQVHIVGGAPSRV